MANEDEPKKIDDSSAEGSREAKRTDAEAAEKLLFERAIEKHIDRLCEVAFNILRSGKKIDGITFGAELRRDEKDELLPLGKALKPGGVVFDRLKASGVLISGANGALVIPGYITAENYKDALKQAYEANGDDDAEEDAKEKARIAANKANAERLEALRKAEAEAARGADERRRKEEVLAAQQAVVEISEPSTPAENSSPSVQPANGSGTTKVESTSPELESKLLEFLKGEAIGASEAGIKKFFRESVSGSVSNRVRSELLARLIREEKIVYRDNQYRVFAKEQPAVSATSTPPQPVRAPEPAPVSVSNIAAQKKADDEAFLREFEARLATAFESQIAKTIDGKNDSSTDKPLSREELRAEGNKLDELVDDISDLLDKDARGRPIGERLWKKIGEGLNHIHQVASELERAGLVLPNQGKEEMQNLKNTVEARHIENSARARDGIRLIARLLREEFHKQGAGKAKDVAVDTGVSSSSLAEPIKAPVIESKTEKFTRKKFSSEAFLDEQYHRFGDSRERYLGVYMGHDGGNQDAFVITEHAIVVADGMGNYSESGILSRLFAQKLAEAIGKGASREHLEKLFEPDTLKSIIEAARSDPRYDVQVKEWREEFAKRYPGAVKGLVGKESFNPFNPPKPEDKETRAATTFSLLADAPPGPDGKEYLVYAVLGDSPLIVIDRDSHGNILGWKMVNEDAVVRDADGKEKLEMVSDKNVYRNSTLVQLSDNRTSGVGLGPQNEVQLYGLEQLRLGWIEKKDNRTVVLASDSLTKLLRKSPAAIEVEATRLERIAAMDDEAFIDFVKRGLDGRFAMALNDDGTLKTGEFYDERLRAKRDAESWRLEAERMRKEYPSLWNPDGTLNILAVLQADPKELELAHDDVTFVAVDARPSTSAPMDILSTNPIAKPDDTLDFNIDHTNFVEGSLGKTLEYVSGLRAEAFMVQKILERYALDHKGAESPVAGRLIRRLVEEILGEFESGKLHPNKELTKLILAIRESIKEDDDARYRRNSGKPVSFVQLAEDLTAQLTAMSREIYRKWSDERGKDAMQAEFFNLEGNELKDVSEAVSKWLTELDGESSIADKEKREIKAELRAFQVRAHKNFDEWSRDRTEKFKSSAKPTTADGAVSTGVPTPDLTGPVETPAAAPSNSLDASAGAVAASAPVKTEESSAPLEIKFENGEFKTSMSEAFSNPDFADFFEKFDAIKERPWFKGKLYGPFDPKTPFGEMRFEYALKAYSLWMQSLDFFKREGAQVLMQRLGITLEVSDLKALDKPLRDLAVENPLQLIRMMESSARYREVEEDIARKENELLRLAPYDLATTERLRADAGARLESLTELHGKVARDRNLLREKLDLGNRSLPGRILDLFRRPSGKINKDTRRREFGPLTQAEAAKIKTPFLKGLEALWNAVRGAEQRVVDVELEKNFGKLDDEGVIRELGDTHKRYLELSGMLEEATAAYEKIEREYQVVVKERVRDREAVEREKEALTQQFKNMKLGVMQMTDAFKATSDLLVNETQGLASGLLAEAGGPEGVQSAETLLSSIKRVAQLPNASEDAKRLAGLIEREIRGSVERHFAQALDSYKIGSGRVRDLNKLFLKYGERGREAAERVFESFIKKAEDDKDTVRASSYRALRLQYREAVRQAEEEEKKPKKPQKSKHKAA